MNEYLRIGDYVEHQGLPTKVLSIRKCQPNGHCIYDLNGVYMTMLTKKIIVEVRWGAGTGEITGDQIKKVEV